MDISEQTVVRKTHIPHVAFEDTGSVLVRPIPLRDKEPWGESWQATILALKAERVRRERNLPLPPVPAVLSTAQENACRTGYSAIYARQKWQDEYERVERQNRGKKREEQEELPVSPSWVHDRLRSSLVSWNATFGPEDEPVPDPNDWNPRSYTGLLPEPPRAHDDDGDWGSV